MADFASVDDETTPENTEEIPFFFGGDTFGVIHRPEPPGLPGWVILNPFGKERDRTNRLFFEWARFLAAAGHWALRFDYRGTGDSSGSFEDYSLHDNLEDVERAVVELERISGMPCRGVIGLRLGADLAAMFAANSGRTLELVMWEPVVKGGRYRNSLLRTAMANEMVVQKGAHRSRDELRRDLAAGQHVSVEGFSLAPPMYDSLRTVDLTKLGRPTSAPILIVQMTVGRGRAPKSSITNLFNIFSEEGPTQLESVKASPVWKETKSFRWSPDELFGTTLEWIEERAPRDFKARAPSMPVSGRITSEASTERPVGFVVEGEKAWGILHEALKPREGVSNAVLVAAGDICRAGLFYPALARKLAGRGWNVLRFDPRGLGGSHGDQGCELLVDFFEKVETGGLVQDTVAALDFMDTECGSGRSVLIGLCGGAVTSVLSAQEDDRVAGIAPLDLPVTFFRHAFWDQKEVSWIEILSQRRSTRFLVKVYHFCRLLKQAVMRFGNGVAAVLSKHEMEVSNYRRLYEERTGEVANLPLLAAIERTIERGMPIFCIFAESADQFRRFEIALPGLRAGRPQADSLIKLRTIKGADHNFTAQGCSEELVNSLVVWLDDAQIPWVQGNAEKSTAE